MGQVDDGLRRSAEVVRVQDDEVGGLVVHVDDEADQPAVILGPRFASRHEDEFAGVAAGAEIMDRGRALGEIVAEEPRVGERPFGRNAVGDRDAIDIAIGAGGPSLVVAREFLRMIVVHELAHLKEFEHNKAFYQLCCHMEPDYHQLEFDLRVFLCWRELAAASER